MQQKYILKQSLIRPTIMSYNKITEQIYSYIYFEYFIIFQTHSFVIRTVTNLRVNGSV